MGWIFNQIKLNCIGANPEAQTKKKSGAQLKRIYNGFTIGFDLQPGSLAAQPAGEHQP